MFCVSLKSLPYSILPFMLGFFLAGAHESLVYDVQSLWINMYIYPEASGKYGFFEVTQHLCLCALSSTKIHEPLGKGHGMNAPSFFTEVLCFPLPAPNMSYQDFGKAGTIKYFKLWVEIPSIWAEELRPVWSCVLHCVQEISVTFLCNSENCYTILFYTKYFWVPLIWKIVSCMVITLRFPFNSIFKF